MDARILSLSPGAGCGYSKIEGTWRREERLSSKALADVNRKLVKVSVLIPVGNGKENQLERKNKKRCSAN
jgi:NMD protein affecting ribosome stability and mRNA decay